MAFFSLLDNLLSTILMVEAVLTVLLHIPFGSSVKTSAASADISFTLGLLALS